MPNRPTISLSEKCTAKIAADIIFRAIKTGQRYLWKMRKAKGYNSYRFISVGEFIRYYYPDEDLLEIIKRVHL